MQGGLTSVSNQIFPSFLCMPSCSIICIKIQKQTWSLPSWSLPLLQNHKIQLYCLVLQVSSGSLCLLGLSLSHLWPQIRQGLGVLVLGVPMADTSFRQGKSSTSWQSQRGLQILSPQFAILLYSLSSFTTSESWQSFPPQQRHLDTVITCRDVCGVCCSFKERWIPIFLLLFLLAGLVKFFLWMGSFFPSKVELGKAGGKHLCDISPPAWRASCPCSAEAFL